MSYLCTIPHRTLSFIYRPLRKSLLPSPEFKTQISIVEIVQMLATILIMMIAGLSSTHLRATRMAIIVSVCAITISLTHYNGSPVGLVGHFALLQTIGEFSYFLGLLLVF